MPTKTNQTYGNALAQKVAIYLEKGGFIAYAHRDYCGMGLIFDAEKQKFAYCSVQDGVGFYVEQGFDSQKEFVTWLAAQSDESMSGKDQDDFTKDNQRITHERLTNLPPIDKHARAQVGAVWDWRK